ncbi:hypothetical protein HU200_059354 [Digitaria exilis]|uniref:AAA+ ATPase domain-containing protein n=1 Tax=Digitaria exilis TaxID=1010633 RepID=A0A835AM55_9POAL|nr:hypothetical protein HU200_059354 [Digitaria exilis]
MLPRTQRSATQAVVVKLKSHRRPSIRLRHAAVTRPCEPCDRDPGGMKATALSWSSLGSLVATAVVVRAAVQEVLPPEAYGAARALLARAAAAFRHPTDTIVVHESDANGVPNELYEAAQLYLGARCLSTAPSVHLHKAHGAPEPVASLPDDHAARDTFRGVTVAWRSQRVDQGSGGGGPRGGFVGVMAGGGGGGGFGRQQRCLRLEFPRRHRDVVRGAYVAHVLAEAAALRLKMRQRKLYTNNNSMFCGGGMDVHQMLWSSHPFQHPSTFDTLAMDPALRDAIRSDLLRFVRRREHYARAGRAWKRGYLLHGPPGTGKTSLIAAIANLLEFDIYDLELTAVGSNSELRRLLASTRPKSVIVVEDIDCSLGLFDRTTRSSSSSSPSSQDAESTDDAGTPRPVHASPFPPRAREKISLSGVLNFVDGLWSSCVGERLIVFTTNHVDRLDPALLRPGRMDRKIELGYCKGHALRVLANNYLGGCGAGDEDDHHEAGDGDRLYEELIGEAERLLEEVHLTPADVAEVFMGCDGDGAHAALQKLVDDLNSKRIGELCQRLSRSRLPAATPLRRRVDLPNLTSPPTKNSRSMLTSTSASQGLFRPSHHAGGLSRRIHVSVPSGTVDHPLQLEREGLPFSLLPLPRGGAIPPLRGPWQAAPLGGLQLGEHDCTPKASYRDVLLRPSLSPSIAMAAPVPKQSMASGRRPVHDRLGPQTRHGRRSVKRRGRTELVHGLPVRRAGPAPRRSARLALPWRCPAGGEADADGFIPALSILSRRRRKQRLAQQGEARPPQQQPPPSRTRTGLEGLTHFVWQCKLPTRCFRCHGFWHVAKECKRPRNPAACASSGTNRTRRRVQRRRTRPVCTPAGSGVPGSSLLSNDRVTTLGVELAADVSPARRVLLDAVPGPVAGPAASQADVADVDDFSPLRLVLMDSTPDDDVMATARSAILVLRGMDDKLVVRRVSIHRRGANSSKVEDKHPARRAQSSTSSSPAAPVMSVELRPDPTGAATSDWARPDAKPDEKEGRQPAKHAQSSPSLPLVMFAAPRPGPTGAATTHESSIAVAAPQALELVPDKGEPQISQCAASALITLRTYQRRARGRVQSQHTPMRLDFDNIETEAIANGSAEASPSRAVAAHLCHGAAPDARCLLQSCNQKPLDGRRHGSHDGLPRKHHTFVRFRQLHSCHPRSGRLANQPINQAIRPSKKGEVIAMKKLGFLGGNATHDIEDACKEYKRFFTEVVDMRNFPALRDLLPAARDLTDEELLEAARQAGAWGSDI